MKDLSELESVHEVMRLLGLDRLTNLVMTICLSIYLSTYLSNLLSIYLSVYLSIYLSMKDLFQLECVHEVMRILGLRF